MGRFSKDATEDIVKLQVGDSQAVPSTVLLADKHVGELGAVAHQVAEMVDFRGKDKAWLYHVAHEEVGDLFCILAVSLFPFLWIDAEDGELIFPGRLHADLETGVSGKPVRQLPQTFGKGREAGLLIFCKAIGVGNLDVCIEPGLVDVNPQQFLRKILKANKNAPSQGYLQGRQGLAIRRKTSAFRKR